MCLGPHASHGPGALALAPQRTSRSYPRCRLARERYQILTFLRVRSRSHVFETIIFILIIDCLNAELGLLRPETRFGLGCDRMFFRMFLNVLGATCKPWPRGPGTVRSTFPFTPRMPIREVWCIDQGSTFHLILAMMALLSSI